MSEDTEIDPKALEFATSSYSLVALTMLDRRVGHDTKIELLAEVLQAYAQERVEAERVRHDNLMGLVNKAMGYAHMVEHPDRHTYGYWIADCDFEPLEAMWKEWVERGTK